MAQQTMQIKNIKPLSKDDYQALFAFEQDNWNYFSQFIPPRPDSYRDYQSFCHIQDELLAEQSEGKIAFFVLYNDNNQIIARVNLRDFTDNSASLGYRVCQSVAGQGVATAIVKQIIQQARLMNLEKLTAIVMNNNPASKKVLLNNGFNHSHTEKNAYEFNGEMMDFFYFVKEVGE